MTSTQGEKLISIRSIQELWKDVKSQGNKIQLTCDGLKSNGISQREESKHIMMMKFRRPTEEELCSLRLGRQIVDMSHTKSDSECTYRLLHVTAQNS